MVEQYTTRLLLHEVDACIDDTQHENYSVPVLRHGHRLLKHVDRAGATGVVAQYAEQDFVDDRERKSFPEPDAAFRAALSRQQTATLSQINVMLRRLLRGSSISEKQMKSVLTPEQYSEYTNFLSSPSTQAEIDYGDGMPNVLRSYGRLLHAADFQYNRFERMSQQKLLGRVRFQSGTVEREHNKAEGMYEKAIERLEEIWSLASPHEQHEIQTWMDRKLDFDAGFDRKVGIDPVNIPRIRGSRSINALDSGLPKLSKRLKRKECQLIALRRAAFDIAFETSSLVEVEERDEELKQKLRERMQRLRRVVSGN